MGGEGGGGLLEGLSGKFLQDSGTIVPNFLFSSALLIVFAAQLSKCRYSGHYKRNGVDGDGILRLYMLTQQHHSYTSLVSYAQNRLIICKFC